MKRSLLVLGLLAGLMASTQGADWLHWRGPTQNGVAYDTGLPATWSARTAGKDNLIWKAAFGGRSTPVVSKGRVFIINNVDEGTVTEQERVMCFDAKTGDKLWEHRFNVFHADIVSSRVGWSNPVADPETGNVYVHGVQGLFFCFNPDGKVLWSKSMTEEYGRITGYGGRVTSPIVDGDLVILHMLNSSWGDQGRGGHRFVAMDKKSGAVVWWAEPGGPPLDTIYSVPVVADINGQRLLICGTADGGVAAMKVRTGEVVWATKFSKRGTNASPVVDGNLVYITNGEDNIDSSEKGVIICYDASKVTNRKPAELWKRYGFEVGYASPIIHEGRLYVCDNSAKMWCFDAKTGKELWDKRHSYGTVAKGSPVLADGKIYVNEVSGRFHIIEPRDDGAKTIHTQRFSRPDGTVVELNGSPAVADGKVYFCTRDELYCIGTAEGKAGTPPRAGGAFPPGTGGPDANPNAAPVHVQVFPADVVLKPGESIALKARCYDLHGHFLKEGDAEWSLPAPPPPAAAPQSKPPALKGTIDSSGKLTVDKDTPAQAAIVVAKVGNVTGRARVRVAPLIPISETFDQAVVGSIPHGWINLGGKFVVEKKGDSNVLKKRADNPALARANAYIGMPESKDYTIEADVMGGQRGPYSPEMGVINSRYTLSLDGTKDRLLLRSWEANIKIGTGGQIESYGRLDKNIPFKWQPNHWYKFKLKVQVKDGKAICQGKVWPRDQQEPDAWTLEVTDPVPNAEGSPALFAYAHGISDSGPGAEVFFDNVKVTPNK